MRSLLAICLLSFSALPLCGQEVIISRQVQSGEAATAAISAIAPVLNMNMDGTRVFSFDGTAFMPSDPLGMLQQKQIQEELDLSDDQLSVVDELRNDIGRQTKEIFSTGVQFGGDAAKLMQTAQKTIREKITKELEGILSTKQFTRLGQLEVQMKIRNRGVLALTESKLADALAVTDEQKKEIRDEQRDSQRELQKEIAALRERYRKRLIKKLLSDEQLSKLESLSGDEYEVKAINRRRFFGQ